MRYTTLLLGILLATAGSAQSLGEIRGKVFDPFGEPVPMAHVVTTVAGHQFGTTTDMEGRFVLKPLPVGTYGVAVSFTSFKTKDIPGVEVTADRATYLNQIKLSFMDAMDTLEVVGYRRPLIKIDDPSRMSLLADEFKNDPTRRNPISFLQSNFAGVTAAPNGDGLYFRGSRTENMVSFIDGVKISGSVPHVPPSAISSVSVYTGGLPAKYGDVTGGVVVMETKSYSEMYEAERARRMAEQEAELFE